MILSSLLQDVTLSDFYRNHWDKKPLLIRGRDNKFKSYYSISEFESRVTENDLRYPQFQLAQDGKLIPPVTYTRSRTTRGIQTNNCVDIPAVYSLWNKGATVILQSLQFGSHVLSDHLNELENELGHRVQTNAYLTPKKSQGFEVHYDTHDVFVLQVEGYKKWRVWGNSVDRKPLKNERSNLQHEPDGPIFFDDTLSQGDLLYIPRGFPHMARSGEATSLHLTIGVHVYRRIDALNLIFQSVLRECENEDSNFWRDSIFQGYKDKCDNKFKLALEDIVTKIRKGWGENTVFERFNEDRRPLNQHLFCRSSEIDCINLNTKLNCHCNGCTNIQKDDNDFTLLYLGRVLTLSESLFDAISIMMDKQYFTPKDIVGYTEESRLIICKHLLREGFIKFDDYDE